MSCIMVDVEADGPIPCDYSMVCFGTVVVEPSLSRTFYGLLRPISWETEGTGRQKGHGAIMPHVIVIAGPRRSEVNCRPESRR